MKKNLINILIIFLISVVITFVFDLFYGGINGGFKSMVFNVLYGFIIGTSISLSGIISKQILKRSDIKLHPLKTYSILLISVFFYITFDVFFVNALWYHFTQGFSFLAVFTNSDGFVSSLLTILIGIIIFFIILSKSYMSKLISAEKEAQENKDRAAKFQYETLKNQINPHFLFNSLNVLSALIYKDAEKADAFTINLANIYRYILDHQDDDLVSLEEELLFVEKYAELQTIRFDQNFKIKIENVKNDKTKYLVPMALQLLIENVFKHNIVSEQHPMEVRISVEDTYIKVSNPIHSKENRESTHGLGLKNIEKRYQILTDKKCEFKSEGSLFVVRIPLLESHF